MLRVENITQNTVLVDRGRVANNFWTRMRGLMGVRQFEAGQGLLISPCNSVHTHFMRMPIDVIYVNEKDQIVAVDSQMPTWRFGRFHRTVRYVIELPSGTATRAACRVGDQLRISTH